MLDGPGPIEQWTEEQLLHALAAFVDRQKARGVMTEEEAKAYCTVMYATWKDAQP